MRVDLAQEMTTSPPHLSLAIGRDAWRVYIFGVTRLTGSWLVQMALVGSSVRTATVCVAAGQGSRAAARQAVELVRQWLQSDDRSSHRFLEADETPAGRALLA